MAYPKRRRIVTCAYCGEQFERMLSRYNGERAYCSIEHRNEGYRLNVPSTQELLDLHEGFPTWRKIAKELGVSHRTLNDWMRAAGIKPHKGSSDSRIGAGGYVMTRTPTGWAYAHRVVMERMLGRGLIKGEEVHHRNGDRTDNRPENLELWHRSHPKSQRLSDVPHCPTCTCSQTETWSELTGNSQSQAEQKRPGRLEVSA